MTVLSVLHPAPPVRPPHADARAWNRALSRWEYQAGRTRVEARPRALFVELTRRCNLTCVMCRHPGQVGAGERMSSALFDRLADELFPTAELVDLRGWGESLILPEFPERAHAAARHGCALRIVTNLSFRRPGIIELLAELEVHVGVSVDTADAPLLKVLRGGASLERIEENLRALAAAYRAAGIEERLNLYVTCQRPALAGLEGVVALAERTGVNDVRLAPVTVPGESPLCLAAVPAEVREALGRVRAAAATRGVRVSLTASMFEGHWPPSGEDACIHPWAYCYVAYDGRVGFCDHLIGPAGDPFLMGDLRTQSFDEVWNGEPWVALRGEHVGARSAHAPRFEECAWCYRNRHLDFEDLLEPSFAAGRAILA